VYRYVVLIWNSANDSATSAANDLLDRLLRSSAQWSRACVGRGFAILHAGASSESGSCTTHVLAGTRGAICGRLFRRGHELQPADLQWADAGEGEEIVSSGGRMLLTQFWGRYVAVLHDASTRDVHVLRDPTGVLPCFMTTIADVHVVFSDLQSVLSLQPISFSINWNYVAAFVAYSALQIRDTGLNEVSEVQAGERITFRAGNVQRRMLWNPLESLQRGIIESADQAVSLIRDTVKRCVHTWASLHRSIVHNLSGGLDSSAVLACLMDGPTRPNVTCLHYFAPKSREDERKQARLAASHFNIELVECPLDPSELRLGRLMQIRPAPRPWFYIYDLEQGPIEEQVAAERGATSIFSGSGGDGLFLQARSELAVADYLRRHGFSLAVMRVALNAARITRTSMWPILRHGILRHLRRPVNHDIGADDVRTLVPADVRSAARANDSLIHPWLADVGRIPPGLRWHILTLSIPPPFYNSFATEREVERTPPLFSQPLIELCLRIPSYLWISDGRDRSLVRRAFASDLPPTIVRRTQKGASARHNLRLMDENAQLLREMLLDGVLVSRGLLDRARLEQMLSRSTAQIGFEYNEVLRQHLCTEVWVRNWSQTTSSFVR
jgi:asparagine synthase (glutamine-hydrolysing)